MTKEPALYEIDWPSLKQAARVRRVFEQIASENNQRELERLMFCIEPGRQKGAVYSPPIREELWNCLVEPSPYSARPVLTYKYVTAVRQLGAVEFTRLFIDRGPVSGELECIKHMQETHLSEIMVTGRRLSKFEADVVSMAVRSPRFLAS